MYNNKKIYIIFVSQERCVKGRGWKFMEICVGCHWQKGQGYGV